MNTQNKQAFKHSVRGTRMAVITALILVALILLNVGVGLLPRSFTNFVADSSSWTGILPFTTSTTRT